MDEPRCFLSLSLSLLPPSQTSPFRAPRGIIIVRRKRAASVQQQERADPIDRSHHRRCSVFPRLPSPFLLTSRPWRGSSYPLSLLLAASRVISRESRRFSTSRDGVSRAEVKFFRGAFLTLTFTAVAVYHRCSPFPAHGNHYRGIVGSRCRVRERRRRRRRR